MTKDGFLTKDEFLIKAILVSVACGSILMGGRAIAGSVEVNPSASGKLGTYTNNVVEVSSTGATAKNGSKTSSWDLGSNNWGEIYGAFWNSSSRNEIGTNALTLNSGFFSNVIYGAYSKMGPANSNTVTVKDGRYQTSIYGGYSKCGGANFNTISISGGTFINGTIYGGYSEGWGDASNNTIILAGVNLSNTVVYGGYEKGMLYSASNNELQLTGKDTTVKQLVNFDKYTFDVTGLSNTNTMLSVKTQLTLGGKTINITNYSASSLKKGETITLISNVKGTFSYTKSNDYTISLSGTSLILTATTVSFVDIENIQPTGTTSNKIRIYSPTEATSNGTAIKGTGSYWKKIYGGYSTTQGAEVSGNEVEIDGTANIHEDVYGGYSLNGTAKKNKIVFKGGDVFGNIYAGYGLEIVDNIIEWLGGIFRGRHMRGNYITITGTSSQFIGSKDYDGKGDIEADGAVVLGDGSTKAIFTVGDGASASELTFISGLDAKANSELAIKDKSMVILQDESTIAGTVTGSGTLKNEGTLTLTNDYTNETGIVNVGTLKVDAGKLKTGVTNTGGTVVLGGGTGSETVTLGGTITDGAVETGGNVTANVKNLQTDKGITNIYVLTLNSDSNGGTLVDDILNGTGTTGGTVVINGNITTGKDVTNAVIINSDKSFNTTGDITGNITNGGTLTTGSDSKVTGDVTNNGTMTAGGEVDGSIVNTGTLTIGAGDVGGDIQNSGTITLTGSNKTLSYDILGYTTGGTTKYGGLSIGGSITLKDGEKLDVNSLTIKEGSSNSLKLNANDVNVRGDDGIVNNSTLILAGGTLTENVKSGSGKSGVVKIEKETTVTLGKDTTIGASGGSMSLTIDGTLKTEAGTKDRTLAPSVTLNSGATLDLRDEGDKKYTTGKFVSNNGSISFDMLADTGSIHDATKYLAASDHDQIVVSGGTASGTLKLGSINIGADIYTYQQGDTLPAGKNIGDMEFTSITLVDSDYFDNFTITGTTTQYGDFNYTFTQDSTNKGQLNITKTAATFGLREIINAEDQTGAYKAEAAGVGTYSYSVDTTNVAPYTTYKYYLSQGQTPPASLVKTMQNIIAANGGTWDGTSALTAAQQGWLNAYDALVAQEGLGTLTPASGKTMRTVTINGNGKALNGGGFAGVTVKGTSGTNEGTLVIANISGISNFKDNVVVTNDGNLYVKDSTMQFNSGVKDSAGTAAAGTLTVENSTVTMGTYSKTAKATDYQIVQKGMIIKNSTFNAYAQDFTVGILTLSDTSTTLNLWGGTTAATRSVLTGTNISGVSGAVGNVVIAAGQYVGINSGNTVAAKVDLKGDLEAAASAFSGGSISMSDGAVLNLKAGELKTEVKGTGTVNIKEGQVDGSAKLAANYLTIDGNTTLTTVANNLSVTNTITDNGTLVLSGGSASKAAEFTNAVSGTGNITISGNVKATKALTLTGETSAITVSSGKALELDVTLLGTSVANSGTITLDADGTNDVLDQVITGGTIAVNGNISSDVANLKGTIANSSKTLTVTTSATDLPDKANLTVGATGAGTLVVDGFVYADSSIANAITVNSGKALKIAASNLGNAVTNNGALQLTDGELKYAVSGAGTVTIAGTVVNSKIITQTGLSINEKSALTSDISNLVITDQAETNPSVVDIANAGTLTLTGTGTFANNLTGVGKLYIGTTNSTSSITLGGTVANTIYVVSGNTMSIGTDAIQNTVMENNGTLVLNAGGTLAENVNGNGTLEINAFGGTVKVKGGTINQKNIEVEAGTLSVDPAVITLTSTDKYITTKTTVTTGGTIVGTLELTGGTATNPTVLSGNIKGDGAVTIPSGSYVEIDGSIEQKISVAGSLYVDPDNIKSDFDLSNGSVVTTGAGVFSQMIGGQGTVNIEHKVTLGDGGGFTPVAYYNVSAKSSMSKAEYDGLSEDTKAAGTFIPVSGIAINLNDTLKIDNDAGTSSGALAGLTMGEGAHLDLQNGRAGTFAIMGNFDAGTSGKLSLDVIDDDNMDSFAIFGNATGTLTLENVVVQSELMHDKAIGEAIWVDIPISGTDTLTINGTTVSYGDYIYTITYEANSSADNDKQLKLVKNYGFKLPELIQAKKDDVHNENAASVTTYSFTQDAINTTHEKVGGGDLGTLGHNSAGAARSFAINGSGHTLNGGGFDGVTVSGVEDELKISDISELNNFDNFVVANNSGTVTISNTSATPTTLVNASVTGTGTLNISGAVMELGTYAYKTTRVTDLNDQNVPGWKVDSKFYSLAEAVAAALAQYATTKATSYTVPGTDITVDVTIPTITQKDLSISTNSSGLIANAGQLVITNAIQNAGSLTLTGGSLNNDVKGTGKVIIDGAVTLGGTISNTITVNSDKTLTISAGNIGNTVTNSGTVKTSGTLKQEIVDGTTAGTIYTTGAFSADAKYLHSEVVNTASKLTLTGGTITKNISGADTDEDTKIEYGDLEITGTVTLGSDVTIAQKNLIVTKDGSFTGALSDLTLNGGSVTNDGTITMTGTATNTVVTGGTGTLNIDGALTQNASLTQGTVNISKNGTLTIAATNLNVSTALTNGGVLTLTGGSAASPAALQEQVDKYTGNVVGTVVVDGFISAASVINNTITINEGKALTISAGNVGGAVTNSGILNLTGGSALTSIVTLSNTITGGTVNATAGYMQNKSSNAISVKALNVGENAALILNGNDLTVSGTLTNDGYLGISGGTIVNEIKASTGKAGNVALSGGSLSVTGSKVGVTGDVSFKDKVASALVVEAGGNATIQPNDITNGIVLNSAKDSSGKITTAAKLTVDESGTFSSVIGGLGVVTINKDVTLSSDASFLPVTTISTGTTEIPVSGVNMILNGKLTLGDMDATDNGAMKSLTMGDGGHLNMENNKKGTLVIAGDFDAGKNGKLSLDVVTSEEMDSFAILGNATGTLTLDKINVMSELIPGVANKTYVLDSGKYYYGYYDDVNGKNVYLDKDGKVTEDEADRVEVTAAANYTVSGNSYLATWVDIPIYGQDDLTINSTNVSDGIYLYTISYEIYSGLDKQLKITKRLGFTMHEVIQGDDSQYADDANGASVALYSLSSDAYNVATVKKDTTTNIGGGYGLGILTRTDADVHTAHSGGMAGGHTNREFTINGDNHSLNGGGWGGITVQEGDILNLTSLGTVSNFAEGIVATNDGTLNLNGGTMTVAAGVTNSDGDKSKGTLKISSAAVTLAPTEQHLEQGATTLDASSETVAAVGSAVFRDANNNIINLTKAAPVVFTQNKIEITSGSLTAQASQLNVNSIVNAGTINLTNASGGNTNTFDAKVTGAGTLVVKAGMKGLTLKKTLGNTLTIESGASVSDADVDLLRKAVTNNGALTLTGNSKDDDGDDLKDTLVVEVSGTGTTSISGSITNKSTLSSPVSIGSGSTLTNGEGGVVSGAVTNGGTLTIAAGSLQAGVTNTNGLINLGTGTLGSYTITGGALKTTGDVTMNVANLQTTGGVTNTNTLTLTNGTAKTLVDSVSGTGGTLVIDGLITTEKSITNAVTVNKDKSLTTSGAIIGAVTNGGTFTTSAGVTGDVTNQDTGVMSITGKVTGSITNSGTLTIGAGNVGGDIYSNGSVTLTGSKATLNYNIWGTNSEYGSVTISGNISVTEGKKLNASALTISDGTNNKLTANASDITVDSTGNIINNATLVLVGGNLTENVVAESGKTGVVSVDSGAVVTLGKNATLGATGGTINGIINVSVDGTLKTESGSPSRSLGSTLTLNSGSTLDLRDEGNRTYTVTNLVSKNATLNFDMISGTGVEHNNVTYLTTTDHDQIMVSGGTASGTIKLGSINIGANIYTWQQGDTLPSGKNIGDQEFNSITLFTGSVDKLVIKETTTQYGDFNYTFTQDSTNKGQLNITKTAATFGLREIINAEDQTGAYKAEAAGVGTYSYNVDTTNVAPYATYKKLLSESQSIPESLIKTMKNIIAANGSTWDGTSELTDTQKSYLNTYDALVASEGLGTLTPASGKTMRTVTVNGNGKTLNGGGFAGVTVKGEAGTNEGTLIIANISGISGFKDNVVVTNDGNLYVKDSTMQFDSGVKDSAGTAAAGTLTVDHSTVTMGTYSETAKETDYQIIQKGMILKNSSFNAYAQDFTVGTLTLSDTSTVLNLWGGTTADTRSVLTGTNISGSVGKVSIAAGQFVGINSGNTVAAQVDVKGNLEANASAFNGGKVTLSDTGVLNLKAGELKTEVAGAGAISITEGQVDSKTKVAAKSFTINENTTFSTAADALTIADVTVAVNGKLILNGGSANAAAEFTSAVTGTGDLSITGNVKAMKALTLTGASSTITVAEGKSLELDVTLLATDVTNKGTVVLDMDGSNDVLIKVITGGTIEVTGSLSSDVAMLKGDVTNSGSTLTLTTAGVAALPDTANLTVAVNGTGSLIVDGFVYAGEKLENSVAINSGKAMKIAASDVGNTISNSGTLELLDGELTSAISGKNGVLEIAGTVTNSGSITQKTLTISTGSTLTSDIGTLTIGDEAITNAGTLILTGTGTFAENLAGDGSLYIGTANTTSNVTLSGTVANTIYVVGGNTLNIGTGKIQNTVMENNGTLVLNEAGILEKNVNGNGTLEINVSGGTVAVGGGTINQKNIVVEAGTLSLDPAKLTLTSTDKDITNDAILLLTGGSSGTPTTLNANIVGEGSTSINSGNYVQIDGDIEQQINVSGTFYVDPDNIKDDVTLVNGVIETVAPGIFSQMIGGQGLVNINHKVTLGNGGGFTPVTTVSNIPVSGVAINLNDTLKIGSDASVSSGALAGLTIGSTGHLDLQNGRAGTFVVAGNFTAVAGSQLSLDVLSDDAMDAFAILGSANGTLSLGTVKIYNELLPEQKVGAGESATTWVDIPITGTDNLTINGVSVALGKYLYTVTYEENPDKGNDKQLKLVKKLGFTLPEIVQNESKNGMEGADIGTYTFAQDALNTDHAYVGGGDLGILTRKQEGSSKLLLSAAAEEGRTLAIGSAGKSLNGGGLAGITVNSGDALEISGFNGINNFKDGVVVANSGTLNVSNYQDETLNLGASVTGAGSMVLKGANINVASMTYYTSAVTDFKGQKFRQVAGKYVDAQNNVLADQSAENVRKNGVMESCDLDAEGNPIPGWYVNGTFYGLSDAVTAATKNYATTGQAEYTVAGDVKVQLFVPEISQENLSLISSTSKLTANADQLKVNGGSISNMGTLILTGGILDENVTETTGTLVVDGAVQATGSSIANKITINAGKSLTTAAGVIDNVVTNDGTVNLTGGTLEQIIKYGEDNSGIINLQGNVSSSADYLKTEVINSGSVLTLTGGVLTENISGQGSLEITGAVTNESGKIQQNKLLVTGSGSFTTSMGAATIDQEITNNGILTLTDSGVNGVAIAGTGTLNIYGTLVQNAGLTQATVNIGKDGTLTIAATNLNVSTVLTNGGVLTLTGGSDDSFVTLQEQVDKYTGNLVGTVVMDGFISAASAINNTITINDGKALIISAGNVGGAVTNSGTLNLTGGDAEHIAILSNPVSGSIVNAAGGYIQNKAGNSISVQNLYVATNTALILNGNDFSVSGALTNDGNMSVSGGTIANEIKTNAPGGVAISGGSLSVTGSTVAVTGDVSFEDKVGSAIVVQAGGKATIQPNDITNGIVLNSDKDSSGKITTAAELVVDDSGTFNSVIGGLGVVTINEAVTLGSNASFLPVATIEKGTVQIPVSGVNMNLNAELTFGDMDATDSGALKSLTMGEGGHLNMENNKQGTLVIAGDFDAGENGKLSLDVVSSGVMDSFAILGNATGTLTLDKVNVMSELIPGVENETYVQEGEKYYYGYYDTTKQKNIYWDKDGRVTEEEEERVEVTPGANYTVSGNAYLATWVDIPIYGQDDLTINSTNVAQGKYLYTIDYDYYTSTDKQLKITKRIGFSLHEVIQGDKSQYVDDMDGAQVSLYSASEDAYNVKNVNKTGTPVEVGGGYDLGILTRTDAGDHTSHSGGKAGGHTNREMTINGNGHNLNGAGWGGITVQEGDTLNLTSLSQVSNFADGLVATNDGTLDLNGGSITVAASVTNSDKDKSKGTLKISDADVTLKPFEYHLTKGATTLDISAGAENAVFRDEDNNAITYTGSLVKFTQRKIEIISGTLTAQPSQLDVETIANTGTLNLNNASDGNNNNFDAEVTGGGKLVVKDGMQDLIIKKTISNTVTIEEGATVSDADADLLRKEVTNNGTLTITSNSKDDEGDGFVDTLTIKIGGNGTTNISGNVNNKGELASKIIVGENSVLHNFGDGVISGGLINKGTVIVEDASFLTGGEDITNEGTFTLQSGTLGRKISGGTIKIEGDVISLTDYIVGETQVEDEQILTLTGGKLGVTVTGGTLNISGEVTTSAEKLKSEIINVTNGILILTDGTLTQPVTGNVKNTGEFTAKLSDLGDFTNEGTLYLDGQLTDDIKGQGTTVLQENINLDTDRTVAGTLDANGKTIDMQEGTGNTVAYSTLDVGALSNTTNLKIDVDLNEGKSDYLKIGSAGTNAKVNVTSVNVVADAITMDDGKITFADNVDGVIYSVEDGQIATTTGYYTYTFTNGMVGGTLNYTMDAQSTTIKDFITGGMNPPITSFTLTEDTTDGKGETLTQGPDILSIYVGGYSLGEEGSQVTIGVGTDKTMNLNGKGGKVYTNWDVDGRLNTSGTITMEGQVTGDGDLNNTGILTITADKLDIVTTNSNGTINLGKGTLNKEIKGGTLNITDDVTTDADNIKSDANTVTSGKTLTLVGEGTLRKDITGDIKNSGTLIINSSVNGKIDNDGTLNVNANNLKGDVDNSKGTVDLTGGTLTKTITDGMVQISGEVNLIADVTGTVNVVESAAANFYWTDYSKVEKLAGSGAINIRMGTIDDETYAAKVDANSKLTLLDNGTYKTAAENVFQEKDTTKTSSGEVIKAATDKFNFVSGILEITDSSYTLDYLNSATTAVHSLIYSGNNSVTKLKMDGMLVNAEKVEADISTEQAAAIGDKVEMPKVTVKAAEGKNNTLIGSATSGDVTLGEITYKDKQAEGFKVNKLDLAADSTGMVITNNKEVVLGGDNENTNNNLISVGGKDDVDVDVVVGTDSQVEGTTATRGKLGIGIQGSTKEEGYQLKGNLTVNKESEVQVNAKTQITGDLNLAGGTITVADQQVVTIQSGVTISNNSADETKASTMLGQVEVQGEEGLTLKDDSNALLQVGNEDGRGTLSVGKVTSKKSKGVIFADPAWKIDQDNYITEASNIATESTALDASYIAGRNSVIAFGTTDITEAERAFAESRLTWGYEEGQISAAVYVYGNVDLTKQVGEDTYGGDIMVDGRREFSPGAQKDCRLNLADNSLLMINGNACIGDYSKAAIKGIETIQYTVTYDQTSGDELTFEDGVAPTSKIYIANALQDETYYILQGVEGVVGMNETSNWWSKENIIINDILEANMTETGLEKEGTDTYYKITTQLKQETPTYYPKTVSSDAFDAMRSEKGSEAYKFMYAVGDTSLTEEKKIAILNRNADLPEELGVIHNHFNVTNISADAVAKHLALDEHTNGREVWAQAIHSKENVSGLGLKTQGNSYDIQYNGTVVGMDIMDNGKTTLGAALTYIDGKASNVGSHNEGKYYGVTLYGSTKLGKDAGVQYDVSYTHSKNELDMASGCNYGQITGDQKVNSFSVGARLEQELKTGHSTSFVPYIGARWLRMKAGSFTSSLGNTYDSDATNSFILPLGLSFKASMQSEGWKMSFLGDVGYQWNTWDRDYRQHFSYNGAGNAFDVAFADSSCWYAGLGFEFSKKDFTAGVRYRYVKGESTRQNKWNVNASWAF